VVFFCCFLVLGTLRFRPRKRAAQWIHKLKNSDRLSNKKTEITTTSSQASLMEFHLLEEGQLKSGAAFQRYQAVFPSTPSYKEGKPASIQEFTTAMLESDNALQTFLDVLRKNPYQAFFFETRPVQASNASSKVFEFVLVDAPALHQFATRKPSPEAFAAQFRKCSQQACSFPSLGGDATLVAPKPPPEAEATSKLAVFSHLAVFCREASSDVVSSTWKLAIQVYQQELEKQSSRRLWFSTSGMGVAWLHFRVDQRPKYYTYATYRDEST
jgi:hypothetical protein